MGRWISRDPIAETGGLNLYGFVGNDGINLYDVLGMFLTTTHKELISNLLTDLKDDYIKMVKDGDRLQDWPYDYANDATRHYDNNSFDAADRFAIKTLAETIPKLDEKVTQCCEKDTIELILKDDGLGALTHQVADFYAHSNWVELHLMSGNSSIPAYMWGEKQVGGNRLLSGSFSKMRHLFGDSEPWWKNKGIHEVTHLSLNKDDHDTLEGSVIVGGISLFEHSKEVASRALSMIYDSFKRSAPNAMKCIKK